MNGAYTQRERHTHQNAQGAEQHNGQAYPVLDTQPSEREELQNEVQQYPDYYHYEWPHLSLGLQPPLLPTFRI